MFEHAKADVDQFAHDRTDDGYLGFTGGLKSLGKVT